jgi:hypothetical protein
MSASFSKENFYKHIKGMKLELKKDRWKIKVQYNTLEELTSNMKSPHCHIQKCQKLSHLLSSWMVPLLVVPNEYHQDQNGSISKVSFLQGHGFFWTCNRRLYVDHWTMVWTNAYYVCWKIESNGKNMSTICQPSWP